MISEHFIILGKINNPKKLAYFSLGHFGPSIGPAYLWILDSLKLYLKGGGMEMIPHLQLTRETETSFKKQD